MNDEPQRAELLSIGSELLVGETVDTNAAFLGAELTKAGLPLSGVHELPDDRAVIATAFTEARARSQLVVATGGLGPTHDDLTREALADALGEELHPDPAQLARLEERFRASGRMPEINRKQAMLVPSAEPLPNPIGSAPGWWVDRDGSVTVLLPGVPSEMRRMWAEQVAPRLGRRFLLPPLHVRVVKTFGIGESAAAERVADLLAKLPPGVVAGVYARDDGVHIRFSSRGDPAPLTQLVEAVRSALGADVWGNDDDDLAAVTLAALGRAGAATVATWEADTEGALLAILAGANRAPGAARFVGGLLDAGGTASAPMADAVLQLSLLPADEHGRSRVRVSLAGAVTLPRSEVRIHGSGPQRRRRAAYAALDQIRRAAG